MFGRKRQQQEREEAAREAERRALFEELAKRPDTICPFLGLEDSRTGFRERVSDAHRCYAFGDPAELSAEQQQKVCLQRGYGNCPRYLRGVLVIPTEELEALRRPQPAPPPQPARPRSVPAPAKPASRGRRRAIAAVLGVLLLAAAGGGAGYWYLSNQVPDSTATATLPAGTDIRGELISLSPPSGGEQQLHATGFIGESDAVATTALVYVLDLSNSTRRGLGCGGDQNGDGRADTPLDCEIAAAAALNDQAVTSGSVAEVGLVGFSNGAVSADLAPADGPQSIVAPDLDDDGDGRSNVTEALESAFAGSRNQPAGFRAHSEVTTESGGTAFSAGIEIACQVLAGTTSANRVVVFLSDGSNADGRAVSSVLPCEPDVTFQTFAAGPDAGCDLPSEFGTLQEMADLTDGACTAVTDLAQLPQLLESVVAPQLLRVELTVDGGSPVDITNVASPALPEAGPADVQIVHSIPALTGDDHEVCLTFFGSDAGGSGSVTSCASADADGGRLTAD